MSDSHAPEAPSKSSTEDRELVERALSGDQAAYQALMDKYQRALYHHVLRVVRTKQEVDDLVQEAFIKAFSALGSYSTQYRSEEHTSELQSRGHLVCRLLLE